MPVSADAVRRLFLLLFARVSVAASGLLAMAAAGEPRVSITRPKRLARLRPSATDGKGSIPRGQPQVFCSAANSDVGYLPSLVTIQKAKSAATAANARIARIGVVTVAFDVDANLGLCKR